MTLIGAFIFAPRLNLVFVIWRPTWCFTMRCSNDLLPLLTNWYRWYVARLYCLRVFSNAAAHPSWFGLHACVWELSGFKIMKCCLWSYWWSWHLCLPDYQGDWCVWTFLIIYYGRTPQHALSYTIRLYLCVSDVSLLGQFSIWFDLLLPQV